MVFYPPAESRPSAVTSVAKRPKSGNAGDSFGPGNRYLGEFRAGPAGGAFHPHSSTEALRVPHCLMRRMRKSLEMLSAARKRFELVRVCGQTSH